MVKRIVCIALSMFLAWSVLYAQQGEYQRKSVSSLGSVLVHPSVYSSAFDQSFFDDLVREYIEVPRFDFNQLSEKSLQQFWRQVRGQGVMSAHRLEQILQQTVGQEIARILKDPDIQEARRAGLEYESDWLRLARIKGKDYGLTEEQLIILMNSAYLYLPYISKMERTQEKDDISYEIEGGIYWFQLHISAQDEVDIQLVESGSRGGIGSAVVGVKSYQKFSLGDRDYAVSENQYAVYDAMQTWVKNLSVVMKGIPNFCLSAQVMQKLSANTYSSNLGRREGVHLDDTFFINEIFEDSKGNQKTKRVGYGRLIKNVDNTQHPERLSELKLFYGSRIMPGVVLQENPRLGMEVAANLVYTEDMDIPASAVFGGNPYHKIRGGIGLNVDLSYNLASIIGITQTYLETRINWISLAANNPLDGSADLYSVSLGLHKKLWLGRLALGLQAAAGIDLFGGEAELNDKTYTSSVMALDAQPGARAIFLLSPSLQLTAGISRHYTFNISSGFYVDGEEYLYSGCDLAKVNLDRTHLELGFNWIIKSFPINFFGWLDPLKKY
ncbi:MAG: hypothetical protein LHW44_01095 [Candidatus Cloacimonetes bacterium]|nr:hypothetical protein [Candidatus Cloacimonadota bacterium]